MHINETTIITVFAISSGAFCHWSFNYVAHFPKTRCTLAYKSKFPPSVSHRKLTSLGRTLEKSLRRQLSTSRAASFWLCIFNIHRASLMKFGRPASLTLWIMNWQKLFVLVLCCLVKSHAVQSHLCLFTHTLPNSHLDMRSDRYWPANSSPHLWFMSAPMSERIKSWSVCACVCTCDRLCEHKFMAAYIYHKCIPVLPDCDCEIKHEVKRRCLSSEYTTQAVGDS